MMIAEEMDADYDRVDVDLSDRRVGSDDHDHGRLVDDPHDVGARAHGRGERAPAPGHGGGGALGRASHRAHGEEVAGDPRGVAGAPRNFGELSAEAAALAIPVDSAPAQAARRLHDHRHAARPQERARDRHGRAEVHARPRRGRRAFPGQREARRGAAPARHQGPRGGRWTPRRRRRCRASSSRGSIPLPERGPVETGCDLPAVDRRRGGRDRRDCHF